MKNYKPGRDDACSFIRSRLISIAEKDAEGAAFPDLQGHLDSCPECASLVRQFSIAWENPAPSEDAQPSPAFFPLLIERIEAEERSSRTGRPVALVLAWRILRPAAVAAIFLGGIFAGHELVKRDETAPSSEVAFAGPLVESFESIPPGSVADFYVTRHDSKKEDL
jgi:hypothetical protein